jgi:hypothetical protein
LELNNSAMNIEARKISLIKEFLKIDNEKIISAIENFLHQSNSKNLEQNIKPMSLEDFYNEIDKAVEDEKNNRITNVKDLKKKIKEWN